MKGLFFYFYEMDSEALTGADKKVLSQVSYFNEKGFPCQLRTFKGNQSLIKKITIRLPFFPGHQLWKYNKGECSDIDWIYFRSPYCLTNPFLKNLKELKRNHPKIKIMMELPTYPYDLEYSSILDYPFLLKDRYNRRNLKGLIDRIVTLTDDEEIFNVPTIKIMNGINLNLIDTKCINLEKNYDSINLGAVAHFIKTHAFERIILGLSDYYSKRQDRKVILHLVGDGEELNFYRKIVEENNLNEFVIFHGSKFGEELDKVYNTFDIGIASLGLHRINVEIGSFLKSREYLAKGLPMITSCEIDILKGKEFKYAQRFPGDESNIDIDRIVDFYDSIYNGEESNSEVIQNIRRYAEKNCGMDIMVDPVIEFLQSKQ